MASDTTRAVTRKRLVNDPDRRMDNVVLDASLVGFPESDFPKLDRTNLDYWIDTLRQGEAQVRRLRKRLEALRDGGERVCGRNGCSRNIFGRSDALYCSTDCRVAAHRERRR
jgi:hypothetical protein